MIFCRVGGLSSVRHKKTNHIIFGNTSPAKAGIYAFIWPYIELYYILWSERNKKELKVKGFRKFKYDGLLWCHFDSKRTLISKGIWFLVETYFLDEILKNSIKEHRKILMGPNNIKIRDPFKIGSSCGRVFDRDIFEVYIEKKYLGKIR